MEKDKYRKWVLTYVAAGENGVELRYEDENIWLTQKMLKSREFKDKK